MTRRRLIRCALGGVVGTSACEPGNPEILAKINAMAESGDFAITGARLSVDRPTTRWEIGKVGVCLVSVIWDAG